MPPKPRPVQGIQLPSAPDFSGPSAKESWKLFKQKWDNYAIIAQLAEHNNSYQVALLLHALGDEGLKIYNGFDFATDADRTPANIISRFDAFAIGELNETYERFVFNQRMQRDNKNFEKFLAELRTLIKTCNYPPDIQQSIIRDRVVLGIADKQTQKRLLREPKLTLETCMGICRAAESATLQGKALNPEAAVDRVTTTQQRPAAPKSKTSLKAMDCKFCGLKHVMRKTECPAWGKKCNNCQSLNHFASKCTESRSKVDNLEVEEPECYGDQGLLTMTGQEDKSTRITAQLTVHGTPVQFLLDTGADINTICECFVNPQDVRPTT